MAIKKIRGGLFEKKRKKDKFKNLPKGTEFKDVITKETPQGTVQESTITGRSKLTPVKPEPTAKPNITDFAGQEFQDFLKGRSAVDNPQIRQEFEASKRPTQKTPEQIQREKDMQAGTLTIRTPEQIAKEKVQTVETPEELAKRLFGETIIPLTEKQQAEDIQRIQEDEKTQLEKRVEEAKKDIDKQLQEEKGAIKAQTAQARGDIQTSLAEPTRTRFTELSEKRAQASLDKLDLAQQRLKSAREAVRRSFESGIEKDQRASALAFQKAETEQLEVLSEIEEQKKEERKEKKEDLLTLSEQNPFYFGSLTTEEAGQQAEEAGLGYNFGVAMQGQQEKLIEARNALLDDPDSIKKQNRFQILQGNIDKLKSETSKDTKFDELEKFTNKLVAGGRMTQEEADEAIRVQLGIGEEDKKSKFEFKAADGQAFVFDPETGKTTSVKTDIQGNTTAPNTADVGNGKITQNYGDKSPLGVDNIPLQNGQVGTPGIDIDGFTGDPIQSFTSGTVTQIATNGGYGNQVIITDDQGNEHMYSHLRDLENLPITLGSKVNAGDTLAFMGNTGSVFDINGNKVNQATDKETGSHLDYRVKSKGIVNNSRWANPNDFIGNAKKGGKKFTESQKAILSSIDPAKITNTNLTVLDDAGLTVNDLGKFLATEKKQLSPDKKQEIQTAMNKLESLIKNEGLEEAVGFGFQKTPFIGAATKDELGAVSQFASGSKAQNFKTEFDTFKSQLMLPLLSKLKGAMSDKDLKFLESASTSLDLSQSEEQFKNIANEMIVKMKENIDEGANLELNLKTELPQEKVSEIYQVILNLRKEGYTDEEIKKEIVERGIDPSIFFN